MSPKLRNVMFLFAAGAIGSASLAFGPLRAQLECADAVAATLPSERTSTTVRAEGRVATLPGGEVTISTETGGRISELALDEGAEVAAEAVLARLDDKIDAAAAAEARAHIAEVDAELVFLEQEVGRNAQLQRQGAIAVRAYDELVAKRDAARARQKGATAIFRRLSATLDKATIRAPIAGSIIRRHADPGEVVPAGAALYTLADLAHTRIEAEVDEFDLARVKKGAQVVISAEGYSGESWRGVVDEIPDAVMPRKLRPQDPGRPTDTRVLLVKIAFSEKTPLKLGQRVELVIER